MSRQADADPDAEPLGPSPALTPRPPLPILGAGENRNAPPPVERARGGEDASAAPVGREREDGGVKVASWLLALDTSTEHAGVALFDGAHLAEIAWPAGRDQTVTVLAQVHHLLDLNGLTVRDIAAVAVATGPGMFSGLRVGAGVAKGLVLGLGVPLLGVPTLDAAALPYADADRPTIAVVAAGRGRLVWAGYGPTPAGWQQTVPPRNGTAADLAARLAAAPAPVIVTGELTPEQAEILRDTGNALVPSPALRPRRPAAVAALAWDRFVAGDVDDAVSLEPVYVHARAADSRR